MIDRRQALADLLSRFARVAIAGGPKAGKSTLAALATDRPVIHTDDFMALPWSDVPAAVIKACADHQRFVVEGVQVPRSLRKGLEVDAVLWLSGAHCQLSDGQRTMAKACRTVFTDWHSGPLRRHTVTLDW